MIENEASKINDESHREGAKSPGSPPAHPEALEAEAFLKDAENEPKRILLADHTKTIVTLRDKKRLTFRAIAEWFAQKGLITDQAAVYRAYLACTPVTNERGEPIKDENRPIDEFDEAQIKQPKKPKDSPLSLAAEQASETIDGGKVEFVEKLLTRQINPVTKAQAVILYRQAFPHLLEKTAHNTVNWVASTGLKRKGLKPTFLSKKTKSIVKLRSQAGVFKKHAAGIANQQTRLT